MFCYEIVRKYVIIYIQIIYSYHVFVRAGIGFNLENQN